MASFPAGAHRHRPNRHRPSGGSHGGARIGAGANYTRVSRDVGVSSLTIQAYYEILCDCLVAERIDPVTRSASRKKLTKASRYLLCD